MLSRGLKSPGKINSYLLSLLLIIYIAMISSTPAAAESTSKIAAVYPQSTHTFILTEDGSLWAWGDNQYGKLGDGTAGNRSIPFQLIIDDLASLHPQSLGHTFALKNDGTLWAWERNWDGRIGAGSEAPNYFEPVQILQDVAHIFPHERHSFALKTDGTLWAWGYNNYGQLGDGTRNNRFEPVQIDLSNVKEIIQNNSNSFAILEDGSLWAWGHNQYGKLGDGSTMNRSLPVQVLRDVEKVFPQDTHTLALKDDGTVWAWGYNWYGQLGDGSNDNQRLPVQANITGVEELYPQKYHAFAQKNDGSLWSWGYNWYGQLGDGSISNRNQPVQIPIQNIREVFAEQHHTFILLEDQTLWGWGRNWDGRLGDGSTHHLRSSPSKIADNIDRAFIQDRHAYAINSEGSTLAWGENSKSQLGNGINSASTSPVNVPLDKVTEIFPQDEHAFAIREDGSLWAWGNNSKGQLGLGTYQRQSVPTQVLLGEDLPLYRINVSGNPQQGGILEGAGSYRRGASVTVKVTVNEGYYFVNWSDDGEVVSSDRTLTFLALRDRNLTANFEKPQDPSPQPAAVEPEEEPETFDITLLANPEEGGTVSGGGEYEEGTVLDLKASANDGYKFMNWTDEDGIEVSGAASFDYTLPAENVTLTANFEEEEPVIPSPVITGIRAENGEIDLTFSRSLDEEPIKDDFKGWFISQPVIDLEAEEPEEPGEDENNLNGSEKSEQLEIESNPDLSEITSNDLELVSVSWNEEQAELVRLTFSEFEPQEERINYRVSVSYKLDEPVIAEPFTVDALPAASDTHTLNLEVNPAESGTVTGSGEYEVEEEIDLSATANEGYEFVSWTLNETEISGEADFSFTMPAEDVTLTANFTDVEEEPELFKISFSVEPEGSGTIGYNGSLEEKEYPAGSTITISAYTNEGYEFVSWNANEETLSTQQSIEYIMPAENIDMVAYFRAKEQEAKISEVTAENGIVSVTFDSELEEMPDLEDFQARYTIEGETGPETEDGSGEQGSNPELEEIISNTLSLVSVSWEQGQAKEVSLSFVPFEQQSEAISYTLSISYRDEDPVESAPFSVEALPEDSPTYILTLESEPAESGTLTGGGEFEEGADVQVATEPAEDYQFVNWTLDGVELNIEAAFTYTMPAKDITLTANFAKVEEEPDPEPEPKLFEVVLSVIPEESGTVEGENFYEDNSAVTITANANEGYLFKHWTEEDQNFSSDNVYTFTIDQDRSLTAVFDAVDPNGNNENEQDPDSPQPDPPTETIYYIDLESEPGIEGKTSGAGVYEAGESALVTAEPPAGYSFYCWLEESEIVSFDEEYTFVVRRNRTLTARFEIEKAAEIYDVTLISSPEEGGTVQGSGVYPHLDIAKLLAIPENNYMFSHWTEDGREVSTEAEYSFRVTNNHTFVAHFELKSSGRNSLTVQESLDDDTVDSSNLTNSDLTETEPMTTYLVELLAEPEDGGEITGGGEYIEGDLVGLNVQPAEGYGFTGWIEDDLDVSMARTYAFFVTRDRTLTAIFEPLLDRQNEFAETYRVSLAPTPLEGGRVYGGGYYTEGETVTISALPNMDYHFLNWIEDGRVISNDIIYTFTLDREYKLEARFVPIFDNNFGEQTSYHGNFERFLVAYFPEFLVPKLTEKNDEDPSLSLFGWTGFGTAPMGGEIE